MTKGIIYKITNITNKMVYIGQTIQSLEKRWNQHIRYANSNHNSSNTAIARAIRKYGKDSFTIEIIVRDVPNYFLNSFEKYWINFYNAFKKGYNCTLGGNGTIGTTPWNKGKTNIYSIATKTKMREAKLGKTPTNLEQLRQLALTRKGSLHQNAKVANIYCYITNKCIAKHINLKSWCIENNHNYGNLCSTARGKRTHSKLLYAKYI